MRFCLVLAMCFSNALASMPMEVYPQLADEKWQKVEVSKPDKHLPPDVAGGGRGSGTQNGPKIIGGTPADSGQFPWQVSNTMNSAGFCGASVISEQYVLTAAHCVEGYDSWLLVFGSLNPGGTTPGSSAQMTRTAVRHEGYDGDLFVNDIAVIRFGSPLTWSDVVSAVRLPNHSQWNETFVGDIARVSGWDGKLSQALMFADMPVIENTECASVYGPTIRLSTLCCSSSIDQTTCNGDSGGPLVWQESDGLFTQIGIVSYGSSAGCLARDPVVFTRVTYFLDWIGANTGVEILP